MLCAADHALMKCTFRQRFASPHEVQLADKLLCCLEAGLLLCVCCHGSAAVSVSRLAQLQQAQQRGERHGCHVRIVAGLVRKAASFIALQWKQSHFCRWPSLLCCKAGLIIVPWLAESLQQSPGSA
jgi:hypothetical protein